MCKAASIEGYKTGHSGKVTCATTLYRQGFSDQVIKEHTGHRSLEALHQYKRTSSNQQHEFSLALAPPAPHTLHVNKENKPPATSNEDKDDFIPRKQAMHFPIHSNPYFDFFLRGMFEQLYLHHHYPEVNSLFMHSSEQLYL